MKDGKMDRRTFIKSVGAAGIAASTLGFPVITKSATKMSEVEIGLVEPMSGPFGSLGNNMMRGWNIGVDEINADGGIKSLGGAKIKTVLGDTESTPRIAMTEIEKVAKNKNIPLVIGCYNSAATFPATQVSEQYKLPHIVDMATQPSILRRGFKYVFRVIMDSERMSQRVVSFVEDMGKRTGHVAKRVAHIATDDNYGKSTLEDMVKALKNSKQELVETIFYPVKVTNLDVEIAKIKAAKPDVVYLCSYLNDGVLITKALQTQNVNPLAFVTQGAGYCEPQYIEMVGDLANYLISIVKFDYDMNRPVEAEFEAKILKRYGVHANQHSNNMYGIAYLVKDVLERAGTIDRDKIRDTIASTNITGGRAMIMPGTHIRFDQNGENTGVGDIVAQVLKGSYHTVWPFEFKRKFDAVWPIPKWEERKA